MSAARTTRWTHHGLYPSTRYTPHGGQLDKVATSTGGPRAGKGWRSCSLLASTGSPTAATTRRPPPTLSTCAGPRSMTRTSHRRWLPLTRRNQQRRPRSRLSAGASHPKQNWLSPTAFLPLSACTAQADTTTAPTPSQNPCSSPHQDGTATIALPFNTTGAYAAA